jgi:hypothetical protein
MGIRRLYQDQGWRLQQRRLPAWRVHRVRARTAAEDRRSLCHWFGITRALVITWLESNQSRSSAVGLPPRMQSFACMAETGVDGCKSGKTLFISHHHTFDLKGSTTLPGDFCSLGRVQIQQGGFVLRDRQGRLDIAVLHGFAVHPPTLGEVSAEQSASRSAEALGDHLVRAAHVSP